MTIYDVFNLGINLGREADPRGLKQVEKELERLKNKYQAMSQKEQADFDKNQLDNPYSDSQILNVVNEKVVKKVLVGIDIGGAELLLAKQLGDIDLVISHHPHGKGLTNLSNVMKMQAQVLANYGLPINIAESVFKTHIAEISRSSTGGNYSRSIDMAKILGLNFICLHTVTDNLATNYLERLLDKNSEKLETVGDLMTILKEIPEYKVASQYGAGPKIFTGHEDNSLGKIALTEITGGTNISKDIYEKMSHYGFGTIVGMHMDEEYRKEAEKYHINVVIAGHMSSDSLGVNLFLDELEKKNIEIMPISGLMRVKR